MTVSIVETTAATFESPDGLDLSNETQQEEFLITVEMSTCADRQAAGARLYAFARTPENAGLAPRSHPLCSCVPWASSTPALRQFLGFLTH